MKLNWKVKWSILHISTIPSSCHLLSLFNYSHICQLSHIFAITHIFLLDFAMPWLFSIIWRENWRLSLSIDSAMTRCHLLIYSKTAFITMCWEVCWLPIQPTLSAAAATVPVTIGSFSGLPFSFMPRSLISILTWPCPIWDPLEQEQERFQQGKREHIKSHQISVKSNLTIVKSSYYLFFSVTIIIFFLSPSRYGFSLVSCANYMFEVLAWISFSMIAGNWLSWLFTLVSGVQMALWAMKKHKAYLKEFPDYPKGRKAMIPFLY